MSGMRRTLLLLAAVLGLSACRVDATVDVAMQPDGSGTVTLTLVADQAVVQSTADLAGDLRFDDAIAAGWTVEGLVDTAEGGQQVVLTRPFSTAEEATALLRSLSGPGGPLHEVSITRTVTDDDITTALTGVARVDGGIDAFVDTEVLTAIGGSPFADDIAATGLSPSEVVVLTFNADLPGSATSQGGGSPVDGRTDVLTWRIPLDGTQLDLTSVFVQGQGRPSGIWGAIATVSLGALVVWCVLAVGFIAFVANARRQRAMRRPPPRYPR